MSRIIAGVLTGSLLVASSLIVAAPAHADPGDASAYGAYAGFDFEFGPIVIDEHTTIGEVVVLEPGTDDFFDEDITLVDAILASVTIDEVATVAESSSTESSADAAALGTSANLFGISVVGFETAAAAVTCPAGGTHTAEAVLEGLTIFGIPVELSDDTASATDSITLPEDALIGEEEYDLSGLTLHATVSQETDVDETWAYANAFELIVEIEGSYANDELPLTVVGTLALAGAACESPTPAPAPTPTPAVLAATGVDAAPLALVGLGALGVFAAGAALLLLRRRAA